MADLIKKIKIKKQDGTFTDYIPIGAEAQNISTSDGDSVQLKLNKKPYYYNTVADMKADLKLKVGDMAVTLGYYEANDGGAAEYRIVQSSDKYIENLNNNLKAELIVKDEINILQAGAKSDGSVSVSSLINSLINLYNDCTIYIPHGDYLVSETIYLDTATKIVGENKFKTRLFTNSAINMIENKNDDIAVCFISNLWIDGNNKANKGIYLYRNRTNLVYNDSRTELRSLMIKKCNDWCLQIGDPNTTSNILEIVVDDIFIHQFTGGGMYVSRCADSHFSNIRVGTGLLNTKPCCQIEGFNLQILSSKVFLSGKLDNHQSGWVFNGGANIVADIEAQCCTKYGVEINNTKNSEFIISSDRNNIENTNYAGILLNEVQYCNVTANIGNNISYEGFETVKGVKIISPNSLNLKVNAGIDIAQKLDLSNYNTSNLLTVNSKIQVNGYSEQDITPEINANPTLPSGITLTKINDNSYLLEGTVSSDQTIWICGGYGLHTAITKLDENHSYILQTGNSNIGMSLFNYTTNLGGGWGQRIMGSNSEITGVLLQLKGNITYNDIISPKIISILN